MAKTAVRGWFKRRWAVRGDNNPGMTCDLTRGPLIRITATAVATEDEEPDDKAKMVSSSESLLSNVSEAVTRLDCLGEETSRSVVAPLTNDEATAENLWKHRGDEWRKNGWLGNRLGSPPVTWSRQLRGFARAVGREESRNRDGRRVTPPLPPYDRQTVRRWLKERACASGTDILTSAWRRM